MPAHEVQSNVYIKHPVSLEQYIMEGSYNKVILSVVIDFNWPLACKIITTSYRETQVLLAKGNVPAESYKYFIDILMTTVR